MSKKGNAILLVMMDIAPEADEAEFNRWYNEEHVPERLGIPGFISGRRFRAVEGSPRYMALFELESPAAVQSDIYHHMVNQAATEWTLKMRKNFRNLVRNVYVQIYPADEPAGG